MLHIQGRYSRGHSAAALAVVATETVHVFSLFNHFSAVVHWLFRFQVLEIGEFIGKGYKVKVERGRGPEEPIISRVRGLLIKDYEKRNVCSPLLITTHKNPEVPGPSQWGFLLPRDRKKSLGCGNSLVHLDFKLPSLLARDGA